jgi:hypothetical protein
MDMDRAYQNGTFIPGAEGYVPRWTAAAMCCCKSGLM